MPLRETSTSSYKKIGTTIQTIRVSKQLTQEYMSNKLGYNDRSSYAKIERGEYNSLDIFLLISICKLLDCNIVHLMVLSGIDIFETSIRTYTEFIESLNIKDDKVHDILTLIEKVAPPNSYKVPN